MDFTTIVQRAKAFAANGTRTVIPDTADTGRASLDTGFPPETEGFGAQPPLRTDVNGALHDIDQGVIAYFFGKIFKFSSALSVAGGGYPLGALVVGDDNTTLWLSLFNNNTINPNTPEQIGWQRVNLNLQGYATEAWVLAQGFIKLSDVPKGVAHSGQTWHHVSFPTGTWTNYTDAPVAWGIGATTTTSFSFSTSNGSGQDLLTPAPDIYASGILQVGETLTWVVNAVNVSVTLLYQDMI